MAMIEVIGIGCRYAGNVGGPRELWARMQSGDTAIGEVPEHRLKKDDFVSIAREADRPVSSRAGWLDGIDRFDALYFRISPREAAELDPQQRLALEVAHEAIFDANVNPERLAGRRVGVFVGASLSEYQAMAFSNPADTTRHTMSGSALSVIANRISYSLDLQGPSITLDTACSSALTALHLACQSLRAGESDLALVLGVNALVGPFPFLGFARAQMLSPTGRCSPFDARADGFVRGEGCGAVLLGSSERPVQPLRRVYARVVGSTINEDGRTASLTMPSGERQVELLQTLRDRAGVRPERIVYVEAHGTGTPVGDPIEARSISAAVLGERRGTLCIGSAKGHFGHLEAGAGIVGFMRAALCAYHRRLVPTAGFESWNPAIDARALALRVPTEVEPLPSPEDGGAACLAVCSYGFGGANASALLCPPGDKPAAPKDETPTGNGADFVVLPLSAHHEPALEEMSGELARRPAAQRRETVRWTGACLPGGRYRRAFVGRPGDGFPRGAWSVHGDAGDAPRRIAFCYAGQGSQHREMSVALYRRFPVYRDAIETADRLFAGHAGYSLLEDHGFCGRGIDDEAQLDVRVALPAIVFAQVALTQLLRHFGIEPAAVMGHSTGEMVAAWACGALSLDDLCLLTGVRARMQSKMREGRMAAWASSAERAVATLAELDIADRVVIGAHNAPEALTLSGDAEAIARAIEHGERAGVRCSELAVKRAYHSPHVADILDELRERLASLQPGPCRLPFISTVSGLNAPDDERRLDADYWVENVARPVDFLSGCRALREQAQAVVEISPRPVLAGYLDENLDCPVVSPLQGRLAEDVSLAHGLAQLFVRGVSVDWSAVDPPKRFVRALRLPWQHDTAYRSAFWKTPALQADGALGADPDGLNITRSGHGFLADHVVENRVVMPAAGFVALAASSGRVGTIADIEFDRFLPLWDNGDRTALKIDRDGSGRWSCATDSGRHAQLTLQGERAGRHGTPAPEVDLAACTESCHEKGHVDRLYAAYSRHSGLHLGPAFQSVREIAFGDAQALGVVRSPPHVRGEFARRTVTLDGCFQVLAFLSGCDSDFVVPTAVGAVRLSDGQLPTGQLLCHASLSALGRDNLTGDLSVWSDGRPVMQVRDLRLVRMPSSASRHPSLYALEYQALGLPRTAAVREPASAQEQLRDVLVAREASRVLRILDRSADGWLDRLAREEPDLFPPGRVFIAAERGAAPDAPDFVHGIDGTAALRPGGFDVVLGRDEGGWAVANGVVIPPDAAHTDTDAPGAETPGADDATKETTAAAGDPDAAPPETGLAVCTLGEDAWGWTGARNVADPADAGLVVDFRDSLTAASATLRSLLEAGTTPAVVFVVREDPDAMPSAMWGFARAARNENPALDAYVLGVAGSAELPSIGAWIEELFEHGPGAEFELRRVGEEWREALEETSPAFGLADLISQRWRRVTKVRLLLITNRELSERVDSRPVDILEDKPVTYSVWDVRRLHSQATVLDGREDMEIDLVQDFGGPLPILPAQQLDADHESYLAVVPGKVLADVYDRWGARLLEQNVRVFLQARGKVNRGIRLTLENEPSMFFAYNNGITATAEEIDVRTDEGRLLLYRLRNFQIVNGGQTTASIHVAKLRKVDLSRTFIQMKLSVVNAERATKLVPRISEYANSQNRVSAADFFSNHPFHIRIEEFSRRIHAPSPDGTFRQSKWFYERARGQYADARARLTTAQRKKFDLVYPRRQLFTKTDLAKFVNVWRQRPHEVSLGAQKNFAAFAGRVGSAWRKAPDNFNEDWYRETIAKAITFKGAERIVSAQAWYQGGYRANIVAYTIAKISNDVTERSRAVDFQVIWRRQSPGEAMNEAIATVAEHVHEVLTNPPEGISNVTEWAKKQACWDRVSRLAIELPQTLVDDLISVQEQRDTARKARSVQRELNGIEAQIAVVNAGGQFWADALAWGRGRDLLSPKETGVLQVAASVPGRAPTDKQSSKAIEVLGKLQSQGYAAEIPSVS